MPTPVKMPRLGESVAEGTIGAWLKQEGEYIERDEALVEIITDKINAELPSPVSGRLAKILVNVDETVAVGVDIALIEESADVNASASELAAPGPDAAPVKNPTQAATPVLEEVESRPAAGAADGVQKKELQQPVAAVAGTGSEVQGEEERQRISPLARRLAHEHGIDLRDIAGTGAGGRVRKEDILAYLEQRENAAQQAPARPAATTVTTMPARPQAQPVAPVQESVAGADEELVTPSRMRLAIAEHMVRSKRTSPHATTVVESDMTNIAKWLEKNK